MKWLRPKPLVVVAFFLLGLLALLFFFGGPQRPVTAQLDQGASGGSSPKDEPGGVDGAPVPAPSGTLTSGAGAADGEREDAGGLPFAGGGGTAPEGGVVMPLIPIPGCRCHSDDPLVVEEHLQYSLSECWDCHSE